MWFIILNSFTCFETNLFKKSTKGSVYNKKTYNYNLLKNRKEGREVALAVFIWRNICSSPFVYSSIKEYIFKKKNEKKYRENEDEEEVATATLIAVETSQSKSKRRKNGFVKTPTELWLV